MTSLSTSPLKDPIVEILMLAARRGFEVMRQHQPQEAEMNNATSESQAEKPETRDNKKQHEQA